jgi:hypothetical protein
MHGADRRVGPAAWHGVLVPEARVAGSRSAAWLGAQYRLRGTTPVYIGIGTIVVIVIIVLVIMLLRRG